MMKKIFPKISATQLKKYAISFVYIFLLDLSLNTFNTKAQIVSLAGGLKAGGTHTWFGGTEALDVENRKGFVGGAFINFSLLKMFSFQPELLFHQKGGINNSFTNRQQININYVETPLLFKFRLPLFGIYPHIFAGPTYARRINSSYSSSNISGDNNHNINATNIRNSDKGAILGAGLDIEIRKLFLTADA